MSELEKARNTVADQIAEFLVHHVTTSVIAGVSGANIEPLFDALQNQKSIQSPAVETTALTSLQVNSQKVNPANTEVVLAKHEFNAATCADAYARITGKLGVCLATSGGGAFNLIAGLAESNLSRVPVLAIVGQPPLKSAGMGAFQETFGLEGLPDLADVFRPITKRVEWLRSADDLQVVFERLLSSALSGVPGPVVLLLPRDVQTQTAAPLKEFSILNSADVFLNSEPTPDPLLGDRPALIVGEAILRHGKTGAVLQISRRLDARVFLTIEALALRESLGDRFGGIVGTFGSDATHAELKRSSGIWALGTRLSQMDRYGIEELLIEKLRYTSHLEPIWSFGANPSTIPWNTLKDLNGQARPSPVGSHPKPTHPIYLREVSLRTQEGPKNQSDRLKIFQVREAIHQSGIFSRPINWIADAGNASASMLKDLKLAPGSSFILALGAGGMGYSLGAGIGAYHANRLPTVVFAGDGSLFMHGLEIHTWVEYQLPILLFIADNQGHGMCDTREALFLRHRGNLNRFETPTDFARGFHELFGIPSVTPQSQLELSRAVATWNQRGPLLIHLPLSQSEFPNFLPFIHQECKNDQLQRNLRNIDTNSPLPAQR
jgi:acetolactate synthase-1/2/3 large subunit